MNNPSATREKALRLLHENPSLIKDNGGMTNQIRQFADQQRSLLDIYKSERSQILDMRKVWSKWILLSILVLVFFDIFIILSIGYGWMNFQGVLIPVFLTESVIKIFGLAYVVVRFLFNIKNDDRNDRENDPYQKPLPLPWPYPNHPGPNYPNYPNYPTPPFPEPYPNIPFPIPKRRPSYPHSHPLQTTDSELS